MYNAEEWVEEWVEGLNGDLSAYKDDAGVELANEFWEQEEDMYEFLEGVQDDVYEVSERMARDEAKETLEAEDACGWVAEPKKAENAFFELVLSQLREVKEVRFVKFRNPVKMEKEKKAKKEKKKSKSTGDGGTGTTAMDDHLPRKFKRFKRAPAAKSLKILSGNTGGSVLPPLSSRGCHSIWFSSPGSRQPTFFFCFGLPCTLESPLKF